VDNYPWQLDNYFFPHQEVRANPAHDPSGGRVHTHIDPSVKIAAIEGRQNTIGVEATIAVNESQSENPPYFFTISAFGMLSTHLEITDQSRAQAAEIGVNLLLGAIRERLATLTARAPWGAFILGPIPLNFSVPPLSSDPDT
jgi:preprotein translocase subunit SecB